MQNAETRKWVEMYAADNDLFFTNYAKAHVALSELNCFDLMGEMNEDERVDGGYQEHSFYVNFAKWFTRDQTLDSDEGKIAIGEFNELWLAGELDRTAKDSDDHGHGHH